jgi:hypothetical protein
MSKLTTKKLLEWCQDEFKRLGIKEYIPTKIIRTRYRPDDYEAGACYLIIKFKSTTLPDDSLLASSYYFTCFYPLWMLDEYLKKGYELYLKFDQFKFLKNTQIEVKKKI